MYKRQHGGGWFTTSAIFGCGSKMGGTGMALYRSKMGGTEMAKRRRTRSVLVNTEGTEFYRETLRIHSY